MNPIRLTILIGLLSLLSPVALSQTDDCYCEDGALPAVWATVNGASFGAADLNQTTRDKIVTNQSEFVRARKNELKFQVNALLLKLDAAKRGVTTDQLLQSDVVAKTKAPTDAEARAFFEANKSTIGSESYESIKPKVLEHLRVVNEKAAAQALAARLRASYPFKQFVEFSSPPVTPADMSKILATVSGTNITTKDVEDSLRPILLAVQKSVYELRKNAVDIWINEKLLFDEARKWGLTLAKLLQREKAKLKPVTDAEASAFFEQYKERIKGTFATAKSEIVEYLAEQQSKQLEFSFVEGLRSRVVIKYFLKQPPAVPPVR